MVSFARYQSKSSASCSAKREENLELPGVSFLERQFARTPAVIARQLVPAANAGNGILEDECFVRVGCTDSALFVKLLRRPSLLSCFHPVNRMTVDNYTVHVENYALQQAEVPIPGQLTCA